jgi:hypothetical protein
MVDTNYLVIPTRKSFPSGFLIEIQYDGWVGREVVQHSVCVKSGTEPINTKLYSLPATQKMEMKT